MASEANNSGGSPALDWDFGSILLQGAFAKLSKGLRWMFWGSVLQVVGGVGLFSGFGLALHGLSGFALKACLVGSGGLLLVGGIVLLLGEQHCLHLQLPFGMNHALPGRRWLQGAYGCHLAVIVARFVKQWLGRGLVSWITLPLSTLGFICLLLFLRRIATVISRPDLRRMVDVIFLLSGATMATVGLAALDTAWQLGLLQAFGRIPGLMLLITPVLTVLSLGIVYLALLWRLATATHEFAALLALSEEPVASWAKSD